ncbi:hypothetical protein [Paraburkholderia sp. J94]|uniref:hypothetical protein n=1 Tax=Paraburkholderia sp. J94 TaxID=2805441 RepID=UPI002AB0A208|nr:hypothetical protein [Paraburkholderia sp. J94]
MNIEMLNELHSELASMVPAFEAKHGCAPTVAVISTAWMHRLVGEIPNCVVYVGGLVLLADPTERAMRLTALEIPDSLRPSPLRSAPDSRALH